MDMREEIIENIRKHNTYLESISLDELKKVYTRLELKEFYSQLHNEKIRPLAYELSQLTEEMKKEEFPDLLGVQYFPVIKKMDFLTQEEKIALDKYLARLRKNYRARSWHLVTNDKDKYMQIEEFLLQKGVIKTSFVISCPHCNDNHLSNYLTKEEKEEFEESLDKYHQEKDYKALDEIARVMDYEYCDECEEEVSVEIVEEYNYEELILMVAAPDLTLQNME